MAINLQDAAERPERLRRWLRFLVPSSVGAAFFLIPLPIGGKVTLLLTAVVGMTKDLISPGIVPAILVVFVISSFCSLLGALKPDTFSGYPRRLFVTGWGNVALRWIALILAVLTYFQLGPEVIWSKNTGGLMLNDLMANLLPFFFWAALLLPLLTDFGLLEFIGTFLRRFMRPLFCLPGRAAVNCTAAWLGSGAIGVVMTDLQYREGYYTGREAITAATGFSVVSVPIVILFAGFLNASELVPYFFLSMVLIGVPLAMIMPRIPPISHKSDKYWSEAPRQGASEDTSADGGLAGALRAALARANESRQENVLIAGLKIISDVWLTVLPLVMVLGAVATIIAEYTPFFRWLSWPFAYYLNWLGVADAVKAAPVLVIGFADVFLPFILGSGIESAQTKFIVGTVAFLQIIYMTEVGALLLKSVIPINLLDLVLIFLIRTIIALPLAVLLSKFLI